MTPTDLEMDDLTPRQLEDIVKKVTRTTNMREFLGIDKALTRITAEVKNNVSKLTEIGDRDIRDRIKKRIADMKEERATRLEITTQNRKELSSQFLQIRQTIEKIIDRDLTLREKVKLIFREKGITITAVLTEFGFIISTIITSLIGGAAGAGGSSTPQKNPTSLKSGSKTSSKLSLDFSAELLLKQLLHSQELSDRSSLVF